jgi:hypothetical protein
MFIVHGTSTSPGARRRGHSVRPWGLQVARNYPKTSREASRRVAGPTRVSANADATRTRPWLIESIFENTSPDPRTLGGELKAAKVVVGPKNLWQLGAGRPMGDGWMRHTVILFIFHYVIAT